jgi:hypothetical protein
MKVTAATRSRRNTMSKNAIEPEKATTAEPGVPQAKGKRTSAKKAKPAKKAGALGKRSIDPR